MRITSKGQVTVPKHIRDRLGISPGDEVGFREEGQAVILDVPKPDVNENAGQRAVRVLGEFGDRMRREGKIDPYFANMTTDQIMEELRGYSQDENDPGFKRSV
jgi:AbrB family looped-hinge helix DNA binding protein